MQGELVSRRAVVIPAKLVSERTPGKNHKLINTKSHHEYVNTLFKWALFSLIALGEETKSLIFTDIIVSSEDAAYVRDNAAKLCTKVKLKNINVHFHHRKGAVAEPHAPISMVLDDILQSFDCQHIGLWQPTNPFRCKKRVLTAMSAWALGEYERIATGRVYRDGFVYHPATVLPNNDPHQLKDEYNTTIYRKCVMDNPHSERIVPTGEFYGWVCTHQRSINDVIQDSRLAFATCEGGDLAAIDIDYPAQFEQASKLINAGFDLPHLFYDYVGFNAL